MRAPVSVVLPTLNAGEELPAALAALVEGVQDGLIRELVVSDGGSTDATRAIAEEAGALIVTGPAGRGGQLRRGAAAAQGEWLLVLHADTRLAPGWTGPVRAHIAHHSDKAGYFRLAFRTSAKAGRLVAWGANFRSRAFGLPYGDQGLLMSRRLYDDVGGYPDIPLMEDVALARGLRGRLGPVDAVATTSPERYLRNGWSRQSGRNLIRLGRFLLGGDPAHIARGYRPKG